jgi:hypothetical protein
VGICGEPAISLHLYTVSLVQWVNPLLTVMRDPGSIPRGYFCGTRILLLALSCYIGDPDVIDHYGLVWGGLHPEPSLGRHADNVIIPLDLTRLFCPGFTLATGSPSRSHVESLKSHYSHTQSHWSSGSTLCSPSWWTRVQSPGGYLCGTGIFLLVLSRYKL